MPLFSILIIALLVLFLILGIRFSFRQIDKENKDSKLSAFEHPSTFEKQPIEWVQKPKEKNTDLKSKEL